MSPAGAAQLVKWINKGHRWAQPPTGRRIAFPGDDPLNLLARGLPLALPWGVGRAKPSDCYTLPSAPLSELELRGSEPNPESEQQRSHVVIDTQQCSESAVSEGGGRTLLSGLSR